MNEKTYQEEEVDPDLTQYLQKPIEKNKRTYTEAFEEEETESDEESNNVPCLSSTKNQIYQVWAQKFEEEGAKMLPVVQKLETLTEAQAQAYLACLKAVQSKTIHKHVTEQIMFHLSHMVCHRNDIMTPLTMQQDEYLTNGVSLMVTDFLNWMGKLGIFLSLFLYASSSRYQYEKEISKNNLKTNTPHETLPPHGVCQGRDGENNTNDKVND